MKRINHWLRAAFGFSRQEANGIIVLIPLMIIIIFSPSIYSYLIRKINPPVIQTPEITKHYLELKKKEEKSTQNKPSYQYKQFYPYDNKSSIEKQQDQKKDSRISKKVKKIFFDINKADSVQFKAVRGIGKVLSSRIIKYRNLLGGYVSKQQLKEVYGLQDSVILALDSLTFLEPQFQPQYLNINTLSTAELRRHPYIGFKEAEAIVNYRFQHGNYEAIEDLSQVKLLDSAAISRLKPYLSFSNGEEQD